MRQALGVKRCGVVGKFRKGIFGMFVGVVCQRIEGFDFTDGSEPVAKSGRKFLPPGFDCKSDLGAPEDERISHFDEEIAARFEGLHESAELCDANGWRSSLLAKLRLQSSEPGAGEVFVFDAGEYSGKNGELAHEGF